MWRNRIGLSFCISSNEISAPLFILADGLILRTPNYDCRRISWRCVSSLNGAHYGTASRGLAKPFLCVCLCVCVWLSFFFPTFFSSCSCSSSPCVGSALLSGRPTEKEETLDVPWFDYGPPVGLSIRVWLGFIQVLFSLTFFLLLCVLFSFFFSSIRRVSSVRFRDSGHDFPGFRRVLFFGLFFLDWPPHRLPPITRKKRTTSGFPVWQYRDSPWFYPQHLALSMIILCGLSIWQHWSRWKRFVFFIFSIIYYRDVSKNTLNYVSELILVVCFPRVFIHSPKHLLKPKLSCVVSVLKFWSRLIKFFS